jgi:hypothetical protein
MIEETFEQFKIKTKNVKKFSNPERIVNLERKYNN